LKLNGFLHQVERTAAGDVEILIWRNPE
jgi:hypothetical protein